MPLTKEKLTEALLDLHTDQRRNQDIGYIRSTIAGLLSKGDWTPKETQGERMAAIKAREWALTPSQQEWLGQWLEDSVLYAARQQMQELCIEAIAKVKTEMHLEVLRKEPVDKDRRNWLVNELNALMNTIKQLKVPT
jgi:hypothetical protein